MKLALLSACCVAAFAGTAMAEPAELILTNARVHTVETARPWAEAVAITNGKIVAVGSAAEMARRKGPQTRVVDLHGRLLLPAFGDAHVHPVFGGLSYSRCALQKGSSVEAYQQIIADCLTNTPGTGVIYGVGWSDGLFPPNGTPRKDVLDAVSKDRPLIFLSVGGHSLWLNSKALALAGITKDTPDPANGHIDRDPNGEPSGSLQEAAMDLVKSYIPAPTPAEIEKSIAYAATLFNGWGITSWHDAGIEVAPDGTSTTLDAYKAVQDRGALTSHVTIALKWENGRGLDQIPGLLRASERAQSYGLTARTVKYYLDGVIPQKTAAMLAPYEHSAERGQSQIPAATLDQAVTQLDARGIEMHVHAIGDAATREALDAVQAAAAKNGKRDRRPMISHLNIVDPADQKRFGRLGVIAVFQPLWASWYPYMELTEQAVGAERMKTIYAANSIRKAGGVLAYGADWPVASANPLEGIESAVTRRTNGDPNAKPLLESEAVTVEQAVRAYTLNVAYANHLEKQTGSIAPGKNADLVVLDKDIFTARPSDIAKTKVLVTLFEGREVFGKLQDLNGSAAAR